VTEKMYDLQERELDFTFRKNGKWSTKIMGGRKN